MPMQAESLEILEKASVAPAQARAIVRAIEIEIAGAQDTLATKRDLDVLRAELAKLGGELHAEIHRAIGSSTRQMYMALLGHMAMTLGFIYFLNTQLR
jgi:ribosome-interacting GTPase 1